ncbi:MAG: hypothetical protein GXY05_11410 [Clostridiales bacterium]|nr:hypothetical protein [Clostridiales bacterium]
MSNRKRQRGINIRVNEQEKQRIERFAGRCKLTVSEYLRQLANGYAPQELPNDRIYDMCWQVELLLEDRRYLGDEQFKSYLVSFLKDTQRILHGQRQMTKTELHALAAENEVNDDGHHENMASA